MVRTGLQSRSPQLTPCTITVSTLSFLKSSWRISAIVTPGIVLSWMIAIRFFLSSPTRYASPPIAWKSFVETVRKMFVNPCRVSFGSLAIAKRGSFASE